MPANIDDKKGLVTTAGAGFKRNGTTVASTATELNEMYAVAFISNMTAGAAFVIFPFAGEITGGYSAVTGNPGGETVVAVAVLGGSGTAGTFTIANGTGAGTNDSLALGAGTKTFSAGTKVNITLSSAASNAVVGFFALIAKRT